MSPFAFSMLLFRDRSPYRHEGDIFYDPLKFKDFGKLFGLDMSRWPKEKTRFRKDTYPGRRWNLGDFILWRRVRGDNDNPSWETELGRGRPAWNVQDAAMVTKHLGDRIDIACGGVDNLYRHHDYTIAVEEGKCYDLFSVLCLIAFFPLSLGLSLYTMRKSPPNITPCDFSGGTSTTSRPLRKTSRKNGRTRPSGFSSGKERQTRTGPGWRRARAPSHLPRPLDKVGVHAVRQGPVLRHNLLAALEGRPLKAFKPKSAYMLILNLGDGRGLLLYRSLALHGKLIFWLKDRIDRRFVKRFSGK
jgi:hypothetical protein